MRDAKTKGLAIGLAMGVVLVWLGAWQAIVVGVLGLAGLLVGKFFDGELPTVFYSWMERFGSERQRYRD